MPTSVKMGVTKKTAEGEMIEIEMRQAFFEFWKSFSNTDLRAILPCRLAMGQPVAQVVFLRVRRSFLGLGGCITPYSRGCNLHRLTS